MTDKYLMLTEDEVEMILEALDNQCVYLEHEDAGLNYELIERIKSQASMELHHVLHRTS